MKKRIMQWIEAATLLTVAWISSCDTGRLQEPVPDDAAVQTTALATVSQDSILPVAYTDFSWQAPVRKDS